MNVTLSEENIRKEFDPEIKAIANYVADYSIESNAALKTAHICLLDTLGCGILALNYSECTKLLGPIVPGATLNNGARVPGTSYTLDPVQAAFNIGTANRWLDFNDTWLAAEWGHPSDNIGGILAIADYLSRQDKKISMRNVLEAIIKAHEIQGIIALENSFNRIGFDHVVLVKLATTAVVTKLLGGNKEQICNAISLAIVDGQSLRTYRHAPNTGTRKSWAAGDATSRGVRLALLAMKGEMGYPSALSAKKWGMYDVYFSGKPFQLSRSYGTYVMENVLFKVAFPAEFHGQTAVEAAFKLHPQVKDKLNEIERIELRTQESAVRIINKQGELYNPADRDHSLQYMVAIALIFGELNADHYENKIAQDKRIDQLREKMHVIEEKKFSQDYLDPEKRSIANAIQIYFKDGSKTEEVIVEYPLGHRRRREESLPTLRTKLQQNLSTQLNLSQINNILALWDNPTDLEKLSVDDFMSLFVKKM